MGTQSVTFNDTPYSFPADAKDAEILEFLDKQPKANSPISPPTPALVRKQGPTAPGAQGMGDDQSLIGKVSNRIGGQGETLNRAATLIAKDPVGSFTPKSKDFSLKRGLQKAYGATVGPIANDVSTLRSHPENALSDALTVGAMHQAAGGEGLPSPEEGVGGSRSSGSQVPESGAGMRSFPESTPEGSGRPSPPPASANVRSTPRDLAGIAHAIVQPNAWSMLDAYQSIKSILAKHNAGTPEVAEANPPHPPPPTAMGGGPVTSTSVRTQGQGMPSSASVPPLPGVATWPAEGTHQFNPEGGQPRPPQPPLERIPDWKTNPAASGTPVQGSVAPQTQGRLTPEDVQSMLKRTGPPRGGKAQAARKLMRNNIKGMEHADE